MTMYHCRLITKKGIVIENFYREGESIQQVKEGLEIFVWPKGATWEIEECEEN